MATEPYKIPRHIVKARQLLNCIGQAHLNGIGGTHVLNEILERHLKGCPHALSTGGTNENKWAGSATHAPVPAKVIKAIARELLGLAHNRRMEGHLRAYEVAIPERKEK